MFNYIKEIYLESNPLLSTLSAFSFVLLLTSLIISFAIWDINNMFIRLDALGLFFSVLPIVVHTVQNKMDK